MLGKRRNTGTQDNGHYTRIISMRVCDWDYVDDLANRLGLSPSGTLQLLVRLYARQGSSLKVPSGRSTSVEDEIQIIE